MTSPINQFSDSTTTADVSTSKNVSLPSNVSSGDVLAVFVFARQIPTITTSASGWVASTSSVDAGSSKTILKAFYKDADGTESGTNITINFSAEASHAIYAVRITGSKSIANKIPDIGFTFADVDESQGDPPSVSPAEGAQDYLWFGLAGKRNDGNITGWDANYTNTGFAKNFNAFAVLGFMDRQLNAASEDPGPIVFADSADWSAATVVFHPEGATDTTAPILSSQSATTTNSTSVDGSVDTDEASGTLYAYISTNTSEGASTVKTNAQQTLTVSSTGTKSVSFSSLTTGTTYYVHFMHEDSAGNQSTVASTSGVTPQPPPGIPATVLENADGTLDTSRAVTRTITRVSDSTQLFTGSQTSDGTTAELASIDLSATSAATGEAVDDRIVQDTPTNPSAAAVTIRRNVEDIS